jgi:uncharacterized protein YeaO (DUF488 family)
MKISIKRAYDPPSPEDGVRILVDRLWPRGISKESLRLDMWLKDVAPSAELRKWFGHDPQRWTEFERRYLDELKQNPAAWEPILQAARKHHVTLLFGAKDAEHNNAIVLSSFLLKHHKSTTTRA